MQFKLLPEDISVDIREDNMAQFYSHIKRLVSKRKVSSYPNFRGLEHFSVRKTTQKLQICLSHNRKLMPPWSIPLF